ncbi:MAG TPA: arginine repressor [Candidatus Pelethocola excrementipullorum]|nr:arginine repressor [Candidatus Pelethocola excrementipullorum]
MKIARHAQILKLINQFDIETQEELAAKLIESGFQVTQATVSRDIRQLKLMKITKEDGHSKYVVLQSGDQEYVARYVRVLKDALISMDIAENLLIVKTVSGMAMAAAAALDELNWSEVVGCIAGDNTIMCAIRSKEEALVVMDKLKKTLESF